MKEENKEKSHEMVIKSVISQLNLTWNNEVEPIITRVAHNSHKILKTFASIKTI